MIQSTNEERIAIHEAGHVVVGLALGEKLERAMLVSERGKMERPITGGRASFRVPSAPLRAIARSLGGYAAEDSFGFAEFPTLQSIEGAGRADDHDFIDAIRTAGRYFMNDTTFRLSDGRIADEGAFLLVPCGMAFSRALIARSWKRVRSFARGSGRDAIAQVASELQEKLQYHPRHDTQIPDGAELMPGRLPNRTHARAAFERAMEHATGRRRG